MGRTLICLIILGGIWLGALFTGIAAIRGGCRKPARGFWLWFSLAVVAIGIGAIGFWTPFSLWPRLAYTWTNGNLSINIDFSWFFAVPMLLGLVAMGLVIRSRAKGAV